MLQENILFENAASFVTYILLAASMILCFFDRQKKMAAMLFIFAVLFGLYAHQIRFLAIISISVFGFLTYLFYDPNTNLYFLLFLYYLPYCLFTVFPAIIIGKFMIILFLVTVLQHLNFG